MRKKTKFEKQFVDMTIQEISKITGIPVRTIYDNMSGKHLPNPTTIEKYMNAGVPFDIAKDPSK